MQKRDIIVNINKTDTSVIATNCHRLSIRLLQTINGRLIGKQLGKPTGTVRRVTILRLR